MMSPSAAFRCLLAGFDTIQAAYYLRGIEGAGFQFERLMVLRDQLRLDKSRSGTVVEIGGESFRLKSHGSSSGYPLILEHRQFTAECGEFNSPSFFVTYRSEALWTVGAEALHRFFLTWADAVGLQAVHPETLSRIDFAFDYYLPAVDFTRDDMVSLSTKDATHREHRQDQTMSFGKGDVMLRVYDKVAEIEQQSDKLWLFQLWGIDAGAWRIEWQVRKPLLKRFGLRQFDDLFEGFGDLLRYLANEHDSLRVQTNDSNRSRWPVHPLWDDLLDRIESFPARGIYREIDAKAVIAERKRRVAVSVYGYLKHLAALLCIESGRDAIGLGATQATLGRLIDDLHKVAEWQVDVARKRDKIRLGG
jgi:hypothetical protein